MRNERVGWFPLFSIEGGFSCCLGWGIHIHCTPLAFPLFPFPIFHFPFLPMNLHASDSVATTWGSSLALPRATALGLLISPISHLPLQPNPRTPRTLALGIVLSHIICDLRPPSVGGKVNEFRKPLWLLKHLIRGVRVGRTFPLRPWSRLTTLLSTDLR